MSKLRLSSLSLASHYNNSGFFPTSSIVSIKNLGSFVRIQTLEGGSFLVENSFNVLKEILLKAGFVRIRNGCLVQVRLIEQMFVTKSGFSLVVNGKEEVALPSVRNEIMEILGIVNL